MRAGVWGAGCLLAATAPLKISLLVVASLAARPTFKSLRAWWRYSRPSARRISLAASGSCDLALCLLPPAGVPTTLLRARPFSGVGAKTSLSGPAVGTHHVNHLVSVGLSTSLYNFSTPLVEYLLQAHTYVSPHLELPIPVASQVHE
jgi:hypothetical protein